MPMMETIAGILFGRDYSRDDDVRTIAEEERRKANLEAKSEDYKAVMADYQAGHLSQKAVYHAEKELESASRDVQEVATARRRLRSYGPISSDDRLNLHKCRHDKGALSLERAQLVRDIELARLSSDRQRRNVENARRGLDLAVKSGDRLSERNATKELTFAERRLASLAGDEMTLEGRLELVEARITENDAMLEDIRQRMYAE
jgi:hypothetical protein